MARIELQAEIKAALVQRLQRYVETELKLEIGAFDAEFLLDFFAEQMAPTYYNQGLADALAAFEGKLEEVADAIYQLEQQSPV
jgi:uncharacterized protein (DUF2164 family)